MHIHLYTWQTTVKKPYAVAGTGDAFGIAAGGDSGFR